MKKLLMSLILLSALSAQADNFTITVKAASQPSWHAKVGNATVATQVISQQGDIVYVTPKNVILRFSYNINTPNVVTITNSGVYTLYYTTPDCSGQIYLQQGRSEFFDTGFDKSGNLLFPDVTVPQAKLTLSSQIGPFNNTCTTGTWSYVVAAANPCTVDTCGFDASTNFSLVKE